MAAIEKDAAVPRCNVRQLANKVLDERLSLLQRCRLANKWPAFVDEEDGDNIPFIDLPDFCYSKTENLVGMTEIVDDEKTT